MTINHDTLIAIAALAERAKSAAERVHAAVEKVHQARNELERAQDASQSIEEELGSAIVAAGLSPANEKPNEPRAPRKQPLGPAPEGKATISDYARRLGFRESNGLSDSIRSVIARSATDDLGFIEIAKADEAILAAVDDGKCRPQTADRVRSAQAAENGAVSFIESITISKSVDLPRNEAITTFASAREFLEDNGFVLYRDDEPRYWIITKPGEALVRSLHEREIVARVGGAKELTE